MSKALVNGFALLGLCVAGLALYIEGTTAQAREEAGDETLELTFFCDTLFKGASCSKALTGPYGHVLSLWGVVPKKSVLDVPNAAVGALFYLLALLPWHRWGKTGATLFLAASFLSLAFCVYLAYVLKFILHEFCIVCVTSYAINVLVFIATVRVWRRLQAAGTGAGSANGGKGGNAAGAEGKKKA